MLKSDKASLIMALTSNRNRGGSLILDFAPSLAPHISKTSNFLNIDILYEIDKWTPHKSSFCKWLFDDW